jgi:D-glycero-D-manno-heptose 1,7-bisphosphate phosphatase
MGSLGRDQDRGVNRAVFLDRDGVINRPDFKDGRVVAPIRLEDFHLMPGIHDLVDLLHRKNFKLVVVTNQPDVIQGRVKLETVEGMHELLQKELKVDRVYACFHVDADGCECRKPKPGMLLTAAKDFHIDLTRSFIIGDTWRDMGAGKAAGCATILLSTSYNRNDNGGELADSIVESLHEAGDLILGEA